MKTSAPLLFLVLFFYTTIVTAQDDNICSIWASLTKESKNGYAGIKGDVVSQKDGNSIIASTYTYPGSVKCYLDSDKYDPAFVAEFSACESMEAAKAKIKALQDEFTTCGKNLSFLEYRTPLSGMPYYYIKETVDNGFYVYSGYLQIGKNKNAKYIPALHIPFNAEALGYINLTNEPDNTEFANAINRFVKESKKSFEGIKGDKIGGDAFNTVFATTFCITNTRCRLERDLSNVTCHILAAKGLSEENLSIKFKAVVGMVASALGKNYAWNKLDDNSVVYFTSLDQVSPERHANVEVHQSYDAEKLGTIYLIINEPQLYK